MEDIAEIGRLFAKIHSLDVSTQPIDLLAHLKAYQRLRKVDERRLHYYGVRRCLLVAEIMWSYLRAPEAALPDRDWAFFAHRRGFAATLQGIESITGIHVDGWAEALGLAPKD